MNKIRKKRVSAIIVLLLGASIAASLVVYALGKNINLYFTPSQIAAGVAPKYRVIRVGGIVVPGSVQRSDNSLQVKFILTDYQKNIAVSYNGILPTLFRERQGIIAEGKLVNGELIADQVLAKHDEKYMPPNISSHTKNDY